MTNDKQAGLGLPEMMISLFLSGMITVALMNQYVGIKQHFLRLQAAMGEALDVQWAGELIRDSIRHAGFTPCLNLDNLIVQDQRNSPMHLTAVELGSDLVIHRMSSKFNVVVGEPSSTYLQTTRDAILHTNQSILIADCEHAEVQNVLAVHNAQNVQYITLEKPLAFHYQPPIYVGEWLQERFFVRRLGLFYQQEHVDELTDQITSMSLKQLASRIQVMFRTKSGQVYELETAIRGLS